jgi:hypothetical protein
MTGKRESGKNKQSTLKVAHNNLNTKNSHPALYHMKASKKEGLGKRK